MREFDRQRRYKHRKRMKPFKVELYMSVAKEKAVFEALSSCRNKKQEFMEAMVKHFGISSNSETDE